MKKIHRLTIRIAEEEFRPVKVKAAQEGQSVTDVIRALLKLWLVGDVELPKE
jgi:predicted DNA binding CopG/RHH family protein